MVDKRGLNAKTRLFCIFLGKDCSKNRSICPAEAPKTASQGQKPLNLPRGGPKDCIPGAKTVQFAPRRPQRLHPRGNARPGYVWRRCLRAQKFGDRVAASLLPSCWNRCESSVEWTVRETFCTMHHSQLSFSLDPKICDHICNIHLQGRVGEDLWVLKIIPIFTKNNKRRYYMPELFRFFGFSFFFYSKENDPLHVHVEGNGGMAKFEWNGTEFALVERHGIKAGDFKKIKCGY